MFAKTIIDSDAFLDMPLSTQALYFHLSMRADDDGFINNPKKIQRMIDASDDDLRVLILKNFIIPFESGIVVIKHWKIHNYIRNDRYKGTVYQEEKALLEEKDNKVYTLSDAIPVGIPAGIPTDNQPTHQLETQVRLGKDSIDKVSIGEEREGENAIPPPKATRARTKFTPPSLEEVQAYCTERENTVDAQRFVDYYASKGWVIGESPMKDWKAAVRNWERREREQNTTLQSFETDDFFSAALANSYKLSGEAVT